MNLAGQRGRRPAFARFLWALQFPPAALAVLAQICWRWIRRKPL